MGKIAWTEKASRHLQTIHEYIAKDSTIYATRFIKSLIKSTFPLENYPRIGRIVPEFPNNEYREIIHRNYRIIYQIVNNDDIEILAVIHCARDLKTAIKTRKPNDE